MDDPDCSGGCVCGSWIEDGCGLSPCQDWQMKEIRTCNPSGCDSEQRCVIDTECGDPTECEYNEIEENCINGEEERVKLDFDENSAINIGPTSDVAIGDYYDFWRAYGIKFDIDDCDGIIDENNLSQIIEVELRWYNDFGETDCSNTDLYVYKRDEDEYTNAADYESNILNKNNYNL